MSDNSIRSSVAIYIAGGGKINQCPPQDQFPVELPPKKKTWQCPQEGHDKEICKHCKNRGRCEFLCAPLEWIDGDVPRRENFINEIMFKFERQDYNTALYDLSQHKTPPNRQEEIAIIPDIQTRAILSMMSVRISKRQIASLLHVSRMTITRLLRPMIPPKRHNKSIIP